MKSGETLWRVSQNYQISLDTLCQINKIKDVTQVREGTKLLIPVSTQSSHQVYYLKKDETLWRVSQRFKVPLETILKINNITDVKKVKTGAKLLIPVKSWQKEYLDYSIPLEGSIKPFVTTHFRGILIFTNSKEDKVRAVESGTVTYVDRKEGYGIVVFIKHSNGFLSTYSGFDKITIKKGDKVSKNQVIGTAGQLSRYKKPGLLFSLSYQKKNLKFDMNTLKFYL
ncbi:MAG: peptidoglycan DD-metalloendopeptidase family protein [Spirochaetes bacterium]|nr:peptidoglycan DD-metalloendopeptidase family protein [Spirochaetota bacterium]